MADHSIEKTTSAAMAVPRIDKTTSGADEILEYAIQYAEVGSYPPKLTKDKKRAVRKRAALLTVDKGEVFFNRGKRKVKVVKNSSGY